MLTFLTNKLLTAIVYRCCCRIFVARCHSSLEFFLSLLSLCIASNCTGYSYLPVLRSINNTRKQRRKKQSRRIYFMPSITLFGNDIRFSYWICALHFFHNDDYAYFLPCISVIRETAKHECKNLQQQKTNNMEPKRRGKKQFTNDTKYSLTE